jgi:t-SNARE complex subunit (syntaxin)
MMNHTNHDSPDANDSGAPVSNELDWIESQLTRLEQDQLEVLRLLVESDTYVDDIVAFAQDREARSKALVSEALAAGLGRAKREVAELTCLVIVFIAIVFVTFDAIHRVPAFIAKPTRAPTSNPTASP